MGKDCFFISSYAEVICFCWPSWTERGETRFFGALQRKHKQMSIVIMVVRSEEGRVRKKT